MENKAMKNKKGVGTLTKIFILIILSSLAMTVMWGFYANIVNDYGDLLNYTEDEDLRYISGIFNESLEQSSVDSRRMHDEYQNYTGTQTTGFDSMILNSFKSVKTFMSSSFKIIFKSSADLAQRLRIPSYWVTAFISILLIVIIITVVSGFLRTTNW